MIDQPHRSSVAGSAGTATPRTIVAPSWLWRKVSNALVLAGALLAAVAGTGWLGLQVQPASFPPFPQQQPELERVPLPGGLPAPVERFYRKIYGESIPVVESAVISGRAEIRPFGVTLPARFRFTHIAGQGYRHYIEATWFGIPVMKVHERYLDGKGIGEMPFGMTASGPGQDQGANLGMWSESLWFPSLFLTDPRVRWEAVDEETALLFVPFEDEEESYVVRFDPGWNPCASRGATRRIRHCGSTRLSSGGPSTVLPRSCGRAPRGWTTDDHGPSSQWKSSG